MSKLKVKFLIDKEKQRVIFAEAGSDFVDVLLSFLTLPLGQIVRLLGKQTGLPSLDSLYKSVEMLDEKYMQTEACKEMLLNPRSAAALICEDLKIKNIHHSNPRDFYFCDSSTCFSRTKHYYTFAENIKCSSCGGLMTTKGSLPKDKSDRQEGIFVHETNDFLVTDNLRVMPISSMRSFLILKEMGIEDVSMLEKKVIDFGTEETLNLLRKSLVSKNPLTEICFPEACVQPSVNCSSAIKRELNFDEEVSETTLKLIFDKKKNNVLYVEAGEHFANQVLSFLTFPLGSILKLMSGNMLELSGCISNMYSSMENMSLDYFYSENCRNMLLTPKLATFYGFKQQMLKLEEIPSNNLSYRMSCQRCYVHNTRGLAFISCSHRLESSQFIEQNLKTSKAGMNNDGAYVFNTIRFMVADNIHISPLSFISAIPDEMNLSISDLVVKDAFLDKAKALLLLSTMLIISNAALTDVFFPRKIRGRKTYGMQALTLCNYMG